MRSIFKALCGALLLALAVSPAPPPAAAGDAIQLPAPRKKSQVSLEQTLAQRRTWRSFQDKPLSLAQLSQLLWAAYGVTAKKWGLELKTVPSAGALYPLDIYAVVGAVKGIPAGVYHFQSGPHALAKLVAGDKRLAAARAALGQMWAAEAPVVLLITGDYARSSVKYGKRGRRYTHMESGSVAQVVFLQAEALGLRAGIIGAFSDRQLVQALGLPAGHEPLLLMPVGYGR